MVRAAETVRTVAKAPVGATATVRTGRLSRAGPELEEDLTAAPRGLVGEL